MLHALLAKSIRSMLGSKGPPLAYLTPPGDPGLFGPDSMSWRVHADFVSMMVGGMNALMLQALHPGALGGVWDHSSFREDLQGRLGRTAGFVAATTYGSREMALASIERVRKIHAQVQGIDELGQPYAATDPRLLAWVHLTEVSSFLRAHQALVLPGLSLAQQDLYFAEQCELGHLMGAGLPTALPTTLAQTQAALETFLPELHYGPRARSVMQLLAHFSVPLVYRPMLSLFHQTALVLLPDWARSRMGLPVIPAERARMTLWSAQQAGRVARNALAKGGVADYARRRVAMAVPLR